MCSCTACGLRENSTIRSTTPIGAKKRRRLEQRRWTQTSEEEVKIALCSGQASLKWRMSTPENSPERASDL